MRTHLVWLVGALVACGSDNPSKQCGPNTTDVNGVCTADDPPPPDTTMCTDGTIKDPVTGDCVLDPAACQDGTVAVGGECVDPGIVTADVEEGSEPNGLGLLGEGGETPAGLITLKPVGEHFVIKGNITPFQDADEDGQLDPDIDSYVVEVAAPVMLEITADGVHGLAAGFVSVAAVDVDDPLATWTRFGINLSGDTSRRQLYLPAAGTYVVAIADTRSLFLSGGAVGPAAGGLPFDYYVTIDQQDVTPTPLTVDANGAAQSIGELAPGETKLFSIEMGLGLNTSVYDVAAVQAVGSLVISNTSGASSKLKGVADADDATGEPAQLTLLGIRTGDSQIVVADTVSNYALEPVDYALTVQTRDAGELSTTGQVVSQPAITTDFSTFFYDVADDGEITGMDLAWNVPVTGLVMDENFEVFANFTSDPELGFLFNDTFQAYQGLLRHRTAGRYYFLVFDPTNDATTISATSSYAPVSTTAVTSATPLTAQTITPFGSRPYTYDATTSPWEAFTIAGDGGTTTGTITGRYLPLDTSFGRLDPLASTCVVNGTDFCADTSPLFTHSYAQAGTTIGRIVMTDVTQKYLVIVRPATTSPAPQVRIDFRPRAFVDLGTIAPGTPVTRTGETLSDTVTVQRYLLKTGAGNGLATTVTPNASLNTRYQVINIDESNRGAAVSNGGVGVADTVQAIQGPEGFTAFTVTSVATLAATQTFNLNVTATAAVTYTQTAGTTAFADACVGGTAIAMQDLDEGFSTATIPTPTGFRLFGFDAPAIRVNSNGFLTTDTTLVCPTVGNSCFFGNLAMPAAGNPNGVIAPYWDDIVLDASGGVCQKTIGTKLVIQWRGTQFQAAAVTYLFQAILDGATGTIEFVYGPTQVPTGQGGTIGLENPVGNIASLVGFNTAGSIAPSTSILFTPN